MAHLARDKQSSQTVEYIFTDAIASDVDDDDDEVYFCDDGSKQAQDVNLLDKVVGCLEGLLMDPVFEAARATFCKTNCHHFEAGADENKLIYTDLFQQHTRLVEEQVAARLKVAMEDFDMEDLLDMLDAHQAELDAEVFDLLLTMGDFQSFKELMLAYKKDMTEGAMFSLVGKPVRVHLDEQSDGDVRPDLDVGIKVSKLSLAAK